jgi:hypothetical protein
MIFLVRCARQLLTNLLTIRNFTATSPDLSQDFPETSPEQPTKLTFIQTTQKKSIVCEDVNAFA